MYFPVCIVEKAHGRNQVRLQSAFVPYYLPIPHELRRFAVCVVVETATAYYLGSGTVTEKGIITAKHLFPELGVMDARIYLYSSMYTTTIVPVRGVYFEVDRDIALLEASVPQFIRPCSIKQLSNINPRRLVAFGCPNACYGVSWRPCIVSYNDDFVVTQDVVIPGVSGGGIIYNYNDKWHVIAVHSFGYLREKTLYSVRVA